MVSLYKLIKCLSSCSPVSARLLVHTTGRPRVDRLDYVIRIQYHAVANSLRYLQQAMSLQDESGIVEMVNKSKVFNSDDKRGDVECTDMYASPPKKVFIMCAKPGSSVPVQTVDAASVELVGGGDRDIDDANKSLKSADFNVGGDKLGYGLDFGDVACVDSTVKSKTTSKFKTPSHCASAGLLESCSESSNIQVPAASLFVENSERDFCEPCSNTSVEKRDDSCEALLAKMVNFSSASIQEPGFATISQKSSKIHESVGVHEKQPVLVCDKETYAQSHAIPLDGSDCQDEVTLGAVLTNNEDFPADVCVDDSVCNITEKELEFENVAIDTNALFAELPFCDEESLKDEVVKDTPGKKKTKKLKKERKKREKGDGDGDENFTRPNYFVAIQVSDPEVVLNVELIQKCLVTSEPALKKALISTKKLHITVKVIVIKSEDDMIRAFAAMESCREKLINVLSTPLKLTFETLGNFQHKVLFATIIDKSQLEQLQLISDTVQSSFEATGFSVDKDFKPHVTIAKLSKAPALRYKKIKKIAEKSYDGHKEKSFGVEEVKYLQLLSMLKPVDAKGYYHCAKEVSLEKDIKDVDVIKAITDTTVHEVATFDKDAINAVTSLIETVLKKATDHTEKLDDTINQVKEQAVEAVVQDIVLQETFNEDAVNVAKSVVETVLKAATHRETKTQEAISRIVEQAIKLDVALQDTGMQDSLNAAASVVEDVLKRAADQEIVGQEIEMCQASQQATLSGAGIQENVAEDVSILKENPDRTES